ncbi:MAG TPA: histidine--tRNA ligase [Elusimicrobiota bacterium]|nr:histidine--tRNA ligase [Elusimicrobiota bacterium]
MRYAAPRGTRDIKENEARRFYRLETVARDIFSRYNYEEIRTPVFETTDLFKRAVGETTDIVEKEIFEFEDRGGRKLALRPEGTAGIVRAYLEHSWDKTGGIRKLFYVGPMFRAERPQAGRYREFWQIGAEYFGNPSAAADAEMLLLVRDFFQAAFKNHPGAEKIVFTLNSIGCAKCRPDYRKALVNFLAGKKDKLCEDCQRRLEKNPLRALDCKVDGPALTDAPRMDQFLCEECRIHDAEMGTILNSFKFDFVRNPRLVRGLDYYNRTVFEVTIPGIGAQDAVAAGGRYDSLVKTLGGPDVPAVGFALGMDRVAMALGEQAEEPSVKIYVAFTGVQTSTMAIRLASAIRRPPRYSRLLFQAAKVELGQLNKSLKSQFRFADSWNADYVLIIGEDEMSRGKVALKNLKAKTQVELDIAGSDDEAIARFVDKLYSENLSIPSESEKNSP